MSLMDRLNSDMKQAMKSKDKLSLNVIRMVKASLQNELISLGKDELTEDEELHILSRELKQRKESLQEYKAAGREELVEKANEEITILNDYLPTQLSKEELEVIIKETIQQTGATSLTDMGKVMGVIMPKVKGRADGSLINQLVKTLLE